MSISAVADVADWPRPLRPGSSGRSSGCARAYATAMRGTVVSAKTIALSPVSRVAAIEALAEEQRVVVGAVVVGGIQLVEVPVVARENERDAANARSTPSSS